jgi:hypothetical protein
MPIDGLGHGADHSRAGVECSHRKSPFVRSGAALVQPQHWVPITRCGSHLLVLAASDEARVLSVLAFEHGGQS